MIFRFTDENDAQWVAIWQSPIRFGISTDQIADIHGKTGIKFCNLGSGEERFLEFAEDELPTERDLERMDDNALRDLLKRTPRPAT